MSKFYEIPAEKYFATRFMARVRKSDTLAYIHVCCHVNFQEQYEILDLGINTKITL